MNNLARNRRTVAIEDPHTYSLHSEWIRIPSTLRPTEDIALDNGVRYSDEIEIVPYPEEELASLCRYYLRTCANVILEELNREYAEIERQASLLHNKKLKERRKAEEEREKHRVAKEKIVAARPQKHIERMWAVIDKERERKQLTTTPIVKPKTIEDGFREFVIFSTIVLNK